MIKWIIQCIKQTIILINAKGMPTGPEQPQSKNTNNGGGGDLCRYSNKIT